MKKTRGPRPNNNFTVPGDLGKVMISDDLGRRVHPEEVLDLEALSKGGKTPSFRLVSADPMAAFSQPALAKAESRAFVRGAEAAFDTAQETARELENLMESLSGKQRDAILGGIRSTVADPTTDDFTRKVLGMLDHLNPGQQEQIMEALRAKDRPGVMKIIDERMAQVKERRWNINKDKENLRGKLDDVEARYAAFMDIKAVAEAPKLQKLGETCFHKCVEAWRTGEIILPLSEPGEEGLPPDLRDSLDIHQTVFVVQHDWARAFDRASDFDDGEFRLPYSEMVFEFRISGRRVCCTVFCGDNDCIPTACMLNVETSAGWALGAAYKVQNGVWDNHIHTDDVCAPILNVCREQIRAICIALEAEVAVTEVVRAPHKLNRKRERKGQLPIFDHHVVSLAHRKRYAPREIGAMEIEDDHPGKRLHFVRGHWRHYPNHKVWIKWFLRGNPDLGFVDKEYRL